MVNKMKGILILFSDTLQFSVHTLKMVNKIYEILIILSHFVEDSFYQPCSLGCRSLVVPIHRQFHHPSHLVSSRQGQGCFEVYPSPTHFQATEITSLKAELVAVSQLQIIFFKISQRR